MTHLQPLGYTLYQYLNAAPRTERDLHEYHTKMIVPFDKRNWYELILEDLHGMSQVHTGGGCTSWSYGDDLNYCYIGHDGSSDLSGMQSPEDLAADINHDGEFTHSAHLDRCVNSTDGVVDPNADEVYWINISAECENGKSIYEPLLDRDGNHLGEADSEWVIAEAFARRVIAFTKWKD